MEDTGTTHDPRPIAHMLTCSKQLGSSFLAAYLMSAV